MTRWVPGLLAVSGALLACGPAASPRIVGPGGAQSPAPWTTEEQSRPVAVRTLRTTSAASFHLIRLQGAEPPHVHDRSDLTVFVLSGQVHMHFADRVVEVGPGDVVEIPIGAPHWAENVSPRPSFAYVVFSPAFDGADRRPIPLEETAH